MRSTAEPQSRSLRSSTFTNPPLICSPKAPTKTLAVSQTSRSGVTNLEWRADGEAHWNAFSIVERNQLGFSHHPWLAVTRCRSCFQVVNINQPCDHCQPQRQPLHSKMPGLDRQLLQSQAFQILRLSAFDERPAPLRIVSFTPESYATIKRRELKKRIVQRKFASRRRDSYQQHVEEIEVEISRKSLSLEPSNGGQRSSDGCTCSHNSISTGPDSNCATQVDGAICNPSTTLLSSERLSPCGFHHIEHTIGTIYPYDSGDDRHWEDTTDLPNSAPVVAHDTIPDGASATESQGVAVSPGNGVVATLPYPSSICNAESEDVVIMVERGLKNIDFLPAQCLLDLGVAATASVAETGPVDQSLSQAGPAIELQNGSDHWRKLVHAQELHSVRDRPGHETFWGVQQDQQLLHLRDVAQLTWLNIVTYFPEMSSSSVKSRYEELTRPKAGRKPKAKRYKQRRYELSKTKRPVASSQLQSKQNVRTREEGSELPFYRQPKHSRPGRIQSRDCSHSTPSAKKSSSNDVSHHTSRSGRSIHHPFRHRPDEGYA